MDYFHSATRGLPAHVWAPFAEGRRARSFVSGELIYFQGSQAEKFYYIVDGRVKSFMSSGDGDERILTLYQTGDIMGEAAFFDGLPRVSSAQAMTACSIVSIDHIQARDTLIRCPELTMALLQYLSRTVRLLSSHVDSMSFLRADQRIARQLLALRPVNGGPIPCTHEDLGYAVGVSRVTASRVLSVFARHGMISTGYREVTILDAEALKQYASL
ncbi:MAG: Crp/Fnr family transcriptional regulator [Intestinimonas sp.]|jgi:CRP/FNR family transcriptional regulator|nr:Crp/Fnr family transcriptional regulator [Intestinimonas sp.]